MKKTKILFISFLIAIILATITDCLCQYPDWENLTSNYVNAVVDDGTYIWTGGCGVARINKLTGEITYYNHANSGLVHNEVKCLAVDSGGVLWIGIWGGGLGSFDGKDWKIYDTKNSGLPDDYVQAILVDSGGVIWIGTWYRGLVRFDGTSWNVFNTGNSGLPDNDITSICIDRNDCKWIGTMTGGVTKFDDVKWTNYTTGNSGLPNNVVIKVNIDKSRNKWISTRIGGLAKFDGTNWEVYNKTNSGIPDDEVQAILVDRIGNKWIGTTGMGLVKYDGSNWTLYNTSNSGLTDDWIQAIAVDSTDNIWIGTWFGGLIKYDGIDWTVFNSLNSGLPVDEIQSIVVDENNNKWIGTFGGGVAKLDSSVWTVYNTTNSRLPDNHVVCITIDSIGNKWVGTANGGMAFFNDKGWMQFNSKNSGLPDDYVTGIAVDENGYGWIGTLRGGLALLKKALNFPEEIVFQLKSSDDTVCAGESVNLGIEKIIKGGIKPFTYSWTPKLNIIDSSVDSVLEVQPSTSRTYTLRLIDSNIPQDTAYSSIYIHVNQLPAKPVIAGRNDTLFSSSSSKYQWYVDSMLMNGETKRYVIPPKNGIYFVEITDSNGCSSMSDLFSYSFNSSATITVADCEGSIGDTIDVKIFLSGKHDLEYSSLTGFSGDLNMNYSLLYPVSVTSRGIVNDGERIISLLMPLPLDGDSTLASMKFRVILGNDTVSNLSLFDVKGIDADIPIAVKDGIFRLKGYCNEGGPRLVNTNIPLSLKIVSENPARDESKLEFSLIEESFIELSLFNVNGIKVETFISDYFKQGRFAKIINLKNVSSGFYLITLKTPTRTISKWLCVLK